MESNENPDEGYSMADMKVVESRINDFTDEQLIEMIEVRFQDYMPEALEIARRVLEKRGGIARVKEKIEQKRKDRRIEDDRRLALAEKAKVEQERKRSVTLKDEKILESWATVIENGRGHAQAIFRKTESSLGKLDIPEIHWETVNVTPSWLKGFFGKRREYILVSNEGLNDYRMYVGARDYGIHLDVQWYLTVEPGFFRRALAEKLGGPGAVFVLDILDQQDLRAYVTTVHRCLLNAVEEILNELGEDTSKLVRKSKGFLEVWG